MDNIYVIILLTILIIFNISVYFLDSFFFRIKLIDNPSKIKIHQKKTPISGGVILFVGFLFNLFYCLYIKNNIFGFERELELGFLIFFLASIFFIIGLYDDIKHITAVNRLLLWSLIIFLSLLTSDYFELKFLYFKDWSFVFDLSLWSKLFTVLCFVIFINSLNLFDGINLQSCIYLIFCFVILSIISGNFGSFFFIFIQLFYFLFLNYKNKSFFGDGGINFLAFLVGVLFILSYDQKQIFADEIFLIMFFPGIDMLRLFIQRIRNGKNPLKGDNHHLHHLYLKKLGFVKTIIINTFNIIIPFLLSFLFKTYISVMIFLGFYLIQLFYCYKKRY